MNEIDIFNLGVGTRIQYTLDSVYVDAHHGAKPNAEWSKPLVVTKILAKTEGLVQGFMSYEEGSGEYLFSIRPGDGDYRFAPVR